MGTIGVNTPSKVSRIPEVNRDGLRDLIEARGTRVAWSQAANCPCRLNDETQQPALGDSCPRCRGLGFFHFGPVNYTPPTNAGTLTPLQQAILDEDGACVISGLVQQIETERAGYTTLGPWRTGELKITVRDENKIGYYDRIILLDSIIAYDEVIEPSGELLQPLRYRATTINAVFSETARLVEGTDYSVDTTGRLVWASTSRIPRGRIAVHYYTHPSYLVMNRPHSMRQSSVYRKLSTRVTPHGSPQELPLQGVIMLEFLRDQNPEDTSGS